MKELLIDLVRAITEHYKDNKRDYAIICVVLAIAIAVATFTSCGTTRAVISKPQAGSYTTVTITTNNPIETSVNPDTNVDWK